jgi:L-alanine-DL-glutamate epimerase-like enolase superfamily enzyme
MPIAITTKVSQLKFRFPFRTSHGERTGTDTVLVRVDYKNHVGYGEATLPPYLDDNVNSVLEFFQLPELARIEFPFNPEEVFDFIHAMHPSCMPGKAALDMALWQLYASLNNTDVGSILMLDRRLRTLNTYTIGVGSPHDMKTKLEFGLASGFEFFKLKLDGANDQDVLDAYLSMSGWPFAVDVNQGWSDVSNAVQFSKTLEKKGCVLIEQPFHKDDREKSAMLKHEINIPIIADEACQTLKDLETCADSFDGINVKLQKCGGITPAIRIIRQARLMNLKVLIGCMSESSIGCNAAKALEPICDWADLDGPFLISNNEQIVETIKKK